ncbi:MAG TPA: hypothetical protein PK771_13255 [Spirochaetota bacterium]|nr:hypothetical protein [Spirochaetota bacterium]
MSYDKETFISFLQGFIPFQCKIAVKANTRTVISIKKGLFCSTVIINSIFLHATNDIINEVIYFIKNFDKSDVRLINSKKIIKNFYEQNSHLIDHNRSKRRINLNHNYKFKDINLLFNESIYKLKTVYYNIDYSSLKISWGRMTLRRTRSIRFGSYNKDRCLIRIHPILDRKDIPDYFIKSIIYHEIGHFIYNILYPNSKTHHNNLFYSLLKQIDENYFKSEKWENENKKIFFL